MKRAIFMIAVAAAIALGGPFLYQKVRGNWGTAPTASVSGGLVNDQGIVPEANLPLEGAPAESLADIFRFDVTTGWVMQRWPRVSVGMADLQRQGYRVPLMTGTELTDLTGSLTYYFDAKQEVVRITFKGETGDVQELTRLMMSRYGFARRMTNDPGVFRYEAVYPGYDAVSVLEIRLAPVVRADDRHRRFKILLQLDRPT